MPSGLSAMIELPGGWSVGDYVGRLSRDKRSLSVDLFARPGSGTADIHGFASEREMVHRLSLVLSLEEDYEGDGSLNSADLVMVVHGTICVATYASRAADAPRAADIAPHVAGLKLSDMTTSERAECIGLQWISVQEIGAQYVAVSATECLAEFRSDRRSYWLSWQEQATLAHH